MKDFAALTIISDIDEMSFKLAKDGLFGQMLVRKSEDVEETSLQRPRLKPGRVPLQTSIFFLLSVIAYGCWGAYVGLQLRGVYFKRMYPHCQTKGNAFSRIGDGVCDEWANNVECLFDAGTFAIYSNMCCIDLHKYVNFYLKKECLVRYFLFLSLLTF